MLAVTQQLIDQGYFRADGEEYAQETGVDFDYPVKSGVRRMVSVDDPLVVRAV